MNRFYQNQSIVAAIAALLLAACGESTTTEKIVEVATGGTEIVGSVGDLPKCTDENEGVQAFVKGETSARICVDGKWFAQKQDVVKDTVFIGEDFSCSTKELKDRSGIKIICNGDSIGVVLNGAQGIQGEQGIQGAKGDDGKGVKGDPGDKGKDGVGCSIAGRSDSTVTISCEDSLITLDLGVRSDISVIDSAELDSEKIATSMQSLMGYSQKGPFMMGSTVYLYELSDGRTLKQTNGNFTSNITSNDGRYKFSARNLVSQYALLVADGHYRNEVTGVPSNSAIKLKAISDLSARTSANVNLLTHLEFERLYYLVTQKKMKVKAAKRQAQAEILNEFYNMDTTGLVGFSTAEDLDVFGQGDADAALLALSILLQGDRTEAELSALLTEISIDIAEDGKWNDEDSHADSIKTAIADWTFPKTLSDFRKNVEGWGLNNGKPVGEFEGFIDRFIAKTYGMKNCGENDNGKARVVNNKRSVNNGKSFYCSDGFLTTRWSTEYLNPNIVYGKMIDWRDRKLYRTVTIGGVTWMAQNLNYADSIANPGMKGNSWCYEDNADYCEMYGRLYSRAAAMDSAAVFSTNGMGCGLKDSVCSGGITCKISTCKPMYPVRGICPDGWHLPTKTEWENLYAAVGGVDSAGVFLKSTIGWKDLNDTTSGNGLDSYGFSVVPAGYRHSSGGVYQNEGYYAYLWTSTQNEKKFSDFVMFVNSAPLAVPTTSSRDDAFSVRCVKD